MHGTKSNIIFDLIWYGGLLALIIFALCGLANSRHPDVKYSDETPEVPPHIKETNKGIYKVSGEWAPNHIETLTDLETGQQYILIWNSSAISITPRLSKAIKE